MVKFTDTVLLLIYYRRKVRNTHIYFAGASLWVWINLSSYYDRTSAANNSDDKRKH